MMRAMVERLEEHTLVNTALLEEATECTALIAERANGFRERAEQTELSLARLQQLVMIAHGRRTICNGGTAPVCARCFAQDQLREIALQLEAPKS
jgi:hypothetical protein